MKAVMLAAMVVQLTTGGAGASRPQGKQASERSDASKPEEDVVKHFSALRQEWKSLKQEYAAAREQARDEAARKAREAEACDEPQPQPAPAPR